jgi:hypothetical protein
MSSLPPRSTNGPHRQTNQLHGHVQTEHPVPKSSVRRTGDAPEIKLAHDIQRQISQENQDSQDAAQRPEPFPRNPPRPGSRTVKHKVQYLSSMTICLAALGDRRRAIVTTADTKLSGGTYGTFGHKVHPVHRDWHVLWAGNASPCGRALDWLARTVDEKPKSFTAMTNLLVEACAENRCIRGQDRSLLLAGFDDRGVAHLATVEDRWRHDLHLLDWTQGTCAAIGTGADKARFVLSLYEHRDTRTLLETLYCAYAAKIFAEDASDVNDETQLYALRPGHHFLFTLEFLAELRAIVLAEGRLPIPSKALLWLKQQFDIG